MTIEGFNHTVDLWIKELGNYDLAELRFQPAPGSWSLGQVCFHLVKNTNYYIEQINICCATNDHMTEVAFPEGIAMLRNNEFPDSIIEGPDTDVALPQPETKEELLSELLLVKTQMNNVAALIRATDFKGKTKHPGLGYFDACDWLQFSEMHFRHHLRQKKRIDEMLRAARQK